MIIINFTKGYVMRKILVFLSIISFAFSVDVGNSVKGELLGEVGATKEVVILDFFASWCISCKKELPLINKLSEDLKNVDIIGIDVDENKKDGLEFVKSLKLDFHIYNDNSQEIIKQFNPVGVPAIYILKDKIIKKIYIGAVDDIDKKLKADILELRWSWFMLFYYLFF